MTSDRAADRYLQRRPDGGYRYVRRVPLDVLSAIRSFQPNHPTHVRKSLRTRSLEEARIKRDAMEQADNDYWSDCLSDRSPMAQQAYERAVKRARFLKLQYRPVNELAEEVDVQELLRRLALVGKVNPDRLNLDAILGGVAEPVASTSLEEALDLVISVVRRQELASKSTNQRRKTLNVVRRGVANFRRVVGDIPIEAITREHALAFHRFWLDRIEPEDGRDTSHSPSSGNKDLGCMRRLYREYMAHIGRDSVVNPFHELRFKDDGLNSRPPFSENWLREQILAPGALDGLNLEARCVVLAMINTGARPSELVNLTSDMIVLEADIPFIDIRRTKERELKVPSAQRRLPLAGVSLEAMRQVRGGFPRYKDRDTVSDTVNKYLREHGLMESSSHCLYSLRHSFEARLKLADVGDEVRCLLMGHKIDRPKYGYSDDLTWARRAIDKIAL